MSWIPVLASHVIFNTSESLVLLWYFFVVHSTGLIDNNLFSFFRAYSCSHFLKRVCVQSDWMTVVCSDGSLAISDFAIFIDAQLKSIINDYGLLARVLMALSSQQFCILTAAGRGKRIAAHCLLITRNWCPATFSRKSRGSQWSIIASTAVRTDRSVAGFMGSVSCGIRY